MCIRDSRDACLMRIVAARRENAGIFTDFRGLRLTDLSPQGVANTQFVLRERYDCTALFESGYESDFALPGRYRVRTLPQAGG